LKQVFEAIRQLTTSPDPPKRPIGYLTPNHQEWCIEALRSPVRREVQAEDGRLRYWTWIEELGRYLRVVTLADGVTLHNAFPDRRFKP